MEAEMKALVSSLVLAALILAVGAFASNPLVGDSFAVAQTYCPNGRC
jgi:hypothetical protein